MQVDLHATHFVDEAVQGIDGIFVTNVHHPCEHTSRSQQTEAFEQFAATSGEPDCPSVADELKRRLSADARGSARDDDSFHNQ